MKRVFAIFIVTLSAVFLLSGCKAGCGCHGDPFGELQQNEIEECDMA